jgi:Ca-activated chloride channel family protein
MASNRIPRIGLLLFMAFSLAFTAWQPALAQEQALQARITQVDASQFPQVTVYVSVTDANGKPVGVDPSLIHLEEAGQVVQAGQVSGVGAVGPLTTMLVMDVSGSMNNGGKLAAAKQAARAYVVQMRPGDQAGLISFNTSIQVVQAVTSDRNALYTAIDSLTAQNDTAMYDALMKAIQVLKPIPGRKAIIALTDGLDNSSTSTNQDVLDAAGQVGLSISTIGLGDPAAGKSFFGVNEASLQTLAKQAGGASAFTADNSALQNIFQSYGRGLQSEYAITYTSPSRLRDGFSRSLTATLGQPGSQEVAAARYNPGGVLPEVAGNSPFLFVGLLLGLIFLIFLPALLGLLFRHKPAVQKSRVKLKT